MFCFQVENLGKQQDWCFVPVPSRIKKNSWEESGRGPTECREMGAAHAHGWAGTQWRLVKSFDGWDWDTPAVAVARAASKARGAAQLTHAAYGLPALPPGAGDAGPLQVGMGVQRFRLPSL